MRCPGCKAWVPIRPLCPRCGAPLGGEPVPLTSDQRKALHKELLRFAVLDLILFGILGMMAADKVFLLGDWTLVLVLLLFSGYSGLRLLLLLRDLRAGTALTRVDLLEKILPPGKGNDYHGRFTELGRLRLPPEIEIGVPKGHHYRLLYSPASRIIWALEPADDPNP